jgi:hypothetical protein
MSTPLARLIRIGGYPFVVAAILSGAAPWSTGAWQSSFFVQPGKEIKAANARFRPIIDYVHG